VIARAQPVQLSLLIVLAVSYLLFSKSCYIKMFITSTVNAMSASGNDVPVVVLTYEEESCLVKLPFSYEARLFPTQTFFVGKSNLITTFFIGLEKLDHACFWY